MMAWKIVVWERDTRSHVATIVLPGATLNDAVARWADVQKQHAGRQVLLYTSAGNLVRGRVQHG